MTRIRTNNPNGSGGWTLEGEITLTHNAVGNLTSVVHPLSIGTTSLGYDLGGRKTSMSDPDLGSWSYAYDRQGRLTRQTDARGKTICLYYDGFERLEGKHLPTGTTCPSTAGYHVTYGYDANHSSTNRSRGQLTSFGNAGHAKWLYYNSQGLLAREEVWISGVSQNYNTYYGYDSYLRPSTLTYPDGEVVTTSYNGMGLPNKLTTSLSTTSLVDGATAGGGITTGVNYDEAGRIRNQRYPLSLQAGLPIWRSQVYRPWTGTDGNSNGRLNYIGIGTAADGYNVLDLSYQYDSFGNVSAFYPNGTWYYFTYDAQNRLLSGYGRSYSYDAAGRLTNYEGAGMTMVRGHAALATGTSYGFDANGNYTTLGTKTLTWDHENHLSSISGGISESYLYDADGQRVKKTSNGVSTYYPNQFYEQTSGLVIKYYYFNGQRIAQRNNSTLYYLHNDHLGGMALTTSSVGNATLGYYSYGRRRTWSGFIPTRHQYTGQSIDGTGLYYYGARYYNPDSGQFLSPDTLVPDPTNLFDYNRLMYVRGNPLRFNDPSGHDLWDVVNSIADFVSGAAKQAVYNNLSALGYPEQINVYAPQAGESVATQAGRVVGSIATAVQGVAEVGGGGAVAAGGVVACGTGVGCLAGAPAVAEGGVLVAHGGTVAVVSAATAGQQLANIYMVVTGQGDPSNGQSLVYESSPKHHPNVRGNISKAPTNGQDTLNNSMQIKSTSPRRIGLDSSAGEFVIFDQTSGGIFHGHVRTWEQLTEEMRNVLLNAGLVTAKGKIR